MRASLSMPSLSASSRSIVLRLLRWDWMMAFDSALITKRGDTPDKPSSGAFSLLRTRSASE